MLNSNNFNTTSPSTRTKHHQEILLVYFLNENYLCSPVGCTRSSSTCRTTTSTTSSTRTRTSTLVVMQVLILVGLLLVLAAITF